MTSYDFTLQVDRVGYLTDEEVDAVYEATEGAATVEDGPDGVTVTFDAEAPSLAAAITHAVETLAEVGLSAVGVDQDDSVTLKDIAERAGVVRETARAWAKGVRGPGGFPPPEFVTSGGEQLWSWSLVAFWLRTVHGSDLPVAPHELVTADRVLAARRELRSESEQDRAELTRLLVEA